MKNTLNVIRTLVTAGLLVTGVSAAEKNVSADTAAADTLVVTCRLVEIPGKFVPNDVYDYVYIMKYRVLSVEKGTYSGKELYAGHYNPLIARKQIHDKMDSLVDGTVEKFVVGEKHRLTLITPIESVWDGAIEDEYFDTELPKYYVLNADLLQ